MLAVDLAHNNVLKSNMKFSSNLVWEQWEKIRKLLLYDNGYYHMSSAMTQQKHKAITSELVTAPHLLGLPSAAPGGSHRTGNEGYQGTSGKGKRSRTPDPSWHPNQYSCDARYKMGKNCFVNWSCQKRM